jgi:hypothetical protein
MKSSQVIKTSSLRSSIFPISKRPNIKPLQFEIPPVTVIKTF